MEYRQLGNSDLTVSAICLGTMTFGEQNDEKEAHAQLDWALAHGINFIDTAEMYPVPPRAETYGETERIIGNWLKRQDRSKVVLATKAAGPARSLNWIRGGPKAFDEANLQAAIDGSLKRLQTDYVDLYQLHWPERNQPMFGEWRFDPKKERPFTPLMKQLEALAKLVEAGKVRYVGVSNEHPWGVMTFVQLAQQFGLPRIVSIQNAFSLLNRTFEGGLAEVCWRESVSLLAYSPLAFGHLTGKYLKDPNASGRLTRFPNFGQRYTKPNVRPAVETYVALAEAWGMSPATLALSWCYHHPLVTSTIIGATSLAQLEANVRAWETKLTDEQLSAIDAVHLRYTNPAP
ncbi:oxidoreductase [Hydrogenophilus thermoluteolus]|uniref:aldo/keto reductase n=1 Tax=Hydrogenophilus thermoluteolus TaxID=297 RepID=UPI0024A36AD8|nr:aldo/keto reductase [Hydrogenophilus thermoluteolus]GLW60716.1 oxidoreductase [Hydrogenophilus thermoluteolus]